MQRIPQMMHRVSTISLPPSPSSPSQSSLCVGNEAQLNLVQRLLRLLSLAFGVRLDREP